MWNHDGCKLCVFGERGEREKKRREEEKMGLKWGSGKFFGSSIHSFSGSQPAFFLFKACKLGCRFFWLPRFTVLQLQKKWIVHIVPGVVQMLLWHGDVWNGLPIKLAYGFAGRGAILKFCGDMQVDISTTYALLSRWRKWRDLRALRAKKPGNLWKMYEIALFSFRSQQNILESHSLTKPWKHKKKNILDLGVPQDHCEMPFRVCFGSEYVALYSSDMSEAAGKKLQHEWAHFPPKYSEFVVGNTFHQQFSTTFPLRCFHQNFPP